MHYVFRSFVCEAGCTTCSFFFAAQRATIIYVKEQSRCLVAKLFAGFASSLADDLCFSLFFGMERFCISPDSLSRLLCTDEVSLL